MDGGVASKSNIDLEHGTVRELSSCNGKTGSIDLDSRPSRPRNERFVQSVAFALALVMMVGAGLGVFSSVMKSPNKEKVGLAVPMFMTHSPILIESEAALTAANGVTGGNGTAGNPFVIEGWVINAFGAASGVGIGISNTTSNLVIRNVDVHSGYSDSAGIALINVTNCTVEHSQSTHNMAGIIAMMCGHVVIQNNTVDSNELEGILVFDTNNAWVAHNIAVDSPNIGVALFNSSGSSVVNNTMSLNSVAGLALEFCNNMTVSGNILENNTEGLMLFMSDWSQIHHNKIFHNANYGVLIMYSQNNTLFSNLIGETLWGEGMLVNFSANNTIYHNDFLGNNRSPQAFDGIGMNRWNLSYPIGGNHWDDAASVDAFSGPDQNILGSDGIVDTPYAVNSSRTVLDSYPLATALTLGDEPTAYFIVTPRSGTTLTSFTFNASRCWEWSINSTVLQVRWDFNGDGTWDTGWSTSDYIQHSYAQAGEYNVKMEVKDQAGHTSNMTWLVEVEPLVIPEFNTLLLPICSMIAIFLISARFGKRR
jgi:parallel beta-helix repeat protein